MKKLISVLLAAALACTGEAQTLYKNVQKGTDGNNRLVESLAVPTGKSLTAEAGSTVTLSGSVGGTPTGGTLNLSSLTITLPATVSGGTSSFQPLDAALTALAAGSDFVQFTGPLTTTKVFTLPDLSATLLYSGGALGTPASGVATNLTGTAAGLTAGNVTTNANLTGDVTSVGNAATLATVNANVGSFGSATAAPTFTVNAKGLITAAGSATVTPAVGSITGLGTGVGTALAANANAAGGFTTVDGAATLTNKILTAPDINAGTADSLTSLSVRSTGAAFDLFLTTPSVFTVNRTLTITPGNADRTITLSGNPTLADWFDQSVKSGASPTFTATNFTGSSGITGTGALNSGSINWTGNIVTTGSITGGAISGTTGSFSGQITSTNTGQVLAALTATTNAKYLRIQSTGGDLYLGTESSVGGGFFTGSGAYDSVLYSPTNNVYIRTPAISATGTISAIATGANGTAAFKTTFPGSTHYGLDLADSTDTSGAGFIAFRKASSAVIGSITRVTTTDAVAFNTTSDRDRKENIRTFTDSGTIIDGLRPVLFNWKLNLDEEFVTGKEPDMVEPDTLDAEGKIVPGKVIEGKPIKTRRADLPADRKAAMVADSTDIVGFIAQEEQEVDPLLIRSGAVTLDAHGVARWRSDAALVPILVAELKALRARVAALEARP